MTTMTPMEEWLARPDGLADRLRAARTEAGLSGKDLGTALRWTRSKISRLELGRQMPSSVDVEAYIAQCGADQQTAAELRRLVSEAAGHRDWRRRMRRGQAGVQADYNELVAKSRTIRYFEVAY